MDTSLTSPFAIYFYIIILLVCYSIVSMRGVPRLKTVKKLKKYPMVSIIVPVRNESDTLQWCLNSLTKLDYPNKEIIVVDGNSNDGSKEIIKKFKNLKFLTEGKLPKGWIGKNWACW